MGKWNLSECQEYMACIQCVDITCHSSSVWRLFKIKKKNRQASEKRYRFALKWNLPTEIRCSRDKFSKKANPNEVDGIFVVYMQTKLESQIATWMSEKKGNHRRRPHKLEALVK